ISCLALKGFSSTFLGSLSPQPRVLTRKKARARPSKLIRCMKVSFNGLAARLVIPDVDFTAVAGGQMHEGRGRRGDSRTIDAVGEESGRAVAKGPVGPAGMPAPEMHLIARVMDGAGLKAGLRRRADEGIIILPRY